MNTLFRIIFAFLVCGILYLFGSIGEGHSDSEDFTESSHEKEEIAHFEEAVVSEQKRDDSKPKYKAEVTPKPLEKTIFVSEDKGEGIKRELIQSTETKNEVSFKEVILQREVPKVKKAQESVSTSLNGGYFEALREQYKSEILDNLPKEQTRKDIIIRYYHHAPDGDKISVLKELGFYIHERPVEGSLINYESNAVFYGDDVSAEELKLVVYYLLKEGMPIKHISKSQYHNGWKSSSIEIGTDTTSNTKAVITAKELQNMEF